MKHTPGPWEWHIEDYSMAHLFGKRGLEDEVMAVSPCEACQRGLKREGGEWKWGRCETPKEADARLIAAAPELLEACSAALKMILPMVHYSQPNLDSGMEATTMKDNELDQLCMMLDAVIAKAAGPLAEGGKS